MLHNVYDDIVLGDIQTDDLVLQQVTTDDVDGVTVTKHDLDQEAEETTDNSSSVPDTQPVKQADAVEIENSFTSVPINGRWFLKTENSHYKKKGEQRLSNSNGSRQTAAASTFTSCFKLPQSSVYYRPFKPPLFLKRRSNSRCYQEEALFLHSSKTS
ncbi:unnamed protein product [Trifolium pratense]|uniref:Uncharacterized protein n=1 Tax=Trifolium pratense TaxID=57577 RepID=A0ACB0LDA0_TRIPR|nr:unnamed protein product [Trifolium pratense]